MMVILTLVCSGSALAGVAVVVAPGSGIGELSGSQVKNVFLGKLDVVSGGVQVEPVNQSDDGALYAEFCDKILNKTVEQLSQYWARRVFSGKGTPPRSLDSDAAVKAYVGSMPNAIGYISSDAVDSSVKVIYRAD